MKLTLSSFLMLGSIFRAGGQVLDRPADLSLPPDAPSVYDITLTALDGSAVPLETYKGKKMLIVNVASECGYTPQYAGLQRLHEAHGDVVAVLGIPCNQFGKQEPGNPEEIAAFCHEQYGVTFRLFEKSDVKGAAQSALYAWLATPSMNGWNDKEPEWNFNKYLIDENGVLIAWFSSRVKPLDDAILSRIR